MICGNGVDIVNIARFERALERWGERFTARLFSDGELSYCMGKRRPATHLAARFAVKEALFKALGTPIKYKDVEVIRDVSGSPSLRVSGLGENYRFNVSISHEKEYAVATVIVEKRAGV
jgi:holo-[acyl-carrier protein] synthase